jgi:putative nucleotidyltransferase with HDIG domain
MRAILQSCPAPPSWSVAWDALDAAFPWIRALAGCPQDAEHHAEGNVWIHLRMVLEELAALPAWRSLPEAERQTVWAAALLHDVAKPECTREEEGRITARHHSRRGSIIARRLLWREGVPFEIREQVCALVRHHQAPFHLLERDDALRKLITVSQTARCDLLALLAAADARGRHCRDQQRLIDNVALFAEYARERGCLSAPWAFASDHARFLYFHDQRRHPEAPAHDDTRGEAVLMSGLPGAGKDHWIAEHLPALAVVSLDALREELGVAPTDEQGAVLDRARGLARGHLRASRPFVWSATNLSRQIRGQCARLFAAYRARIRVVYVEAAAEVLFRQNQGRQRRVPTNVVEAMLDRWEVPDLTEAHRVDWVG